MPILFIVVVAIPNLLALIYYLFVASPIYVSEARFLVRMPAERSMANIAGLGSVLEGVGLKSADTDVFAVHEYIMSRNAIEDLRPTQPIAELFGRPEADFLARYPRPFQNASSESLYKAYERFVTVEYDTTTGMSSLLVKAFRPEDAHALATALLDQSEEIVNRLNRQAETDAVNEALRDQEEAEMRLAAAQAELTRYRNQNQIVDPQIEGEAGLALIGRMATELATLRAERNAMAASTPQNPQLPGLEERIRAYESQLNRERAQIAGARGSLASMIGEFERLSLEREFMARGLTAATLSVEEARMEARRKQLYLQRVVEPLVAQSPQFPKKPRNLLLVLVTTLLAWGAIALISAGLREHRQS